MPVDRAEGGEELELAVYKLPRDGVLVRGVGALQAGDVPREVGSAYAGLACGDGLGEGVEDEGVLLFGLLKRIKSDYKMCKSHSLSHLLLERGSCAVFGCA